MSDNTPITPEQLLAECHEFVREHAGDPDWRAQLRALRKANPVKHAIVVSIAAEGKA